jgi:hypothetical protein
VPAALFYSGKEADCALAYTWEGGVPAGVFDDRMNRAAATVHGSLVFVGEDAIEANQLIRVDALPLADADEEVAVVSNLIVLSARRVQRPVTSMIPALIPIVGGMEDTDRRRATRPVRDSR